MPTTIYLISDFNVEVFGRYLTNDEIHPLCRAELSPFGQVFQSLSVQPQNKPESCAAVVWTRPEGVLQRFRCALDLEEVTEAEVLAEVDFFVEQLLRYAQWVKYLFVTTWTLPVGYRGYGILDYRPGIGVAYLLSRINLYLAERLASAPNIYVLDAERWIRASGSKAVIPKMWYAGKIPYSNQVFQDAVGDVKAALQGLAGLARKLVIVDLDNTLWGGVVGETGWQWITLGGHDHEGEAFVDFQKALKSLSNRGVQLGIASKNDEATALETIDRHPEMILRRKDFAGWRINWNDKAQNIVDLVEELNLGLSSVVFLDDNHMERQRIRDALPEVLTPDWPDDPSQYRAALQDLRCFDVPLISAEDRSRTQMYVAERERRSSHQAVGSVEDWLKTLEIQVKVEPLNDTNLARAAQLLNKTNQLNLSTRRLSEGELKKWVESSNRALWTFSVADKFGLSGLTGIVSVEIEGQRARIVDFILSCRVMGRKIEETMLHQAVAFARERGAVEVIAEYRPTNRNAPCLTFLKQSSFASIDELVFTWDAKNEYPLPEVIAITRGGENK
jgi:FkbH-like protein